MLLPGNLSRTRSQKLVREYRQQRNDRGRGWPHQAPPPEPPPWLVQVSVRQKRARSIGPNATGASTSRSILRRATSLALTARQRRGALWGEVGLRARCMLSSSPRLATRELQGKYNQSCQQYRSNNSISPKPATKRFLIFRIEPLILVDDLSAHRPLHLYGAHRPTPCMASAAVMAITKWSISGLEKSVPAEDQQSKRLRCAAIVFSYRHYVAAYLAGRVHRAVPPNQN